MKLNLNFLIIHDGRARVYARGGVRVRVRVYVRVCVRVYARGTRTPARVSRAQRVGVR